MKILIEIDDDIGKTLDELAKKENRSRSAQARHIIQDALKKEAEKESA